MPRPTLYCAALLALLSGPLRAESAPIDWRAAYLDDLRAAHAAISAQHPGPVDPEQPDFRTRLDDGLAEGLTLAERIDDEAGYFYGLRRFGHRLADPHTGILREREAAVRWPGFLLVEQGGRWVVQRDAGDAAAPAAGAELLHCDGETPAALAARRVYPYALNPTLAAHRREAASRTLIDRGNPLEPLPAECVFRHAGERQRVRLDWTPIEAAALESRIAAVLWGERDPAIRWRAPAEGVVWLQIPTFYPESAADHAALEGLIERLAREREALTKARLIVFDVRGNGGGSSLWGERLIRALWGPAAEPHRPAEPSATDWRATPEALAYWQALRPQLAPQFAQQPELQRYLDRTIAGLTEALAAGQTYYREVPEAAEAAAAVEAEAFGVPVLFLTDGQCASACLNFADWMRRLPDVTHVGAETSADAVYIESRFIALPSGQSRLLLSQKVVRGGVRGNLQPYRPAVRYDGVWSTAAVTDWVLSGLATGQWTRTPQAQR